MKMVKSRGVVFCALFLAAATTAVCQPANSLEIRPGAIKLKEFGAATLEIYVSKDAARVDVQVKLLGRSMMERPLTPVDSSLKLDLQNGDAAIHGSLLADFGYPSQRSYLAGDFTVTQGTVTNPFHGDLGFWQWSTPVVRQYSNVWITPELNAQASLLLDQKQTVQIQFLTAGQEILNVTLAQGVNDVTVLNGYHVGTVTIAPGMTLHLQPSTPVQLGDVNLVGTFSSTNHPDVKYAGALISWTYLPPPRIREEPQ